MVATRTDIHRPSAIIPEDYAYVGQECIQVEHIGEIELLLDMKAQIRAHMEKTGGTYSRHAHGGNCMVCGNANAIYTILFYHEESNTYVRMGQDCATKCEMAYGDTNYFRRQIENARLAYAGKQKAHALLADHGLLSAWYLYITPYDQVHDKYEENTICDIVAKLVRYGDLSERQWDFLKKLLNQIATRAQKDAQRAEERASAQDCPTGKVEIRGTVVKTDVSYNAYGSRYVMTVKDTRGFLVWGTIPSFLHDVKKGDTVTFKANVLRSDKDAKFGFYKRPTKK